MKKVIATLVTTMLVGATAAWAEDQATPTTTVGEAVEITKGVFDKAWTVTPRIGAYGFGDSGGNYTSRIVEGFTTNLSLANAIGNMPAGMEFGLESGLLYSHTGSPGSNFFGSNSDMQIAEGNNSFLVPINAALGYKFADNWLAALNLGSTLVHRSIGNAYMFGRSGDASPGSATEFFPDLGVNLAWAAGKNIALSLRGDVIPTPAQDLYTATLGATIGLT